MSLTASEIANVAKLVDGADKLNRLMHASGFMQGNELVSRVSDWSHRIEWSIATLGAAYRDSLPARFDEIEAAVKDLEAAAEHFAKKALA